MNHTYWEANYAATASRDNHNRLVAACTSNLSLFANRLLDRMHHRAFKRHLRASGLKPGAVILDVGCGGGRWVRRLRKLGFAAFGAEPAGQALNRLTPQERPWFIRAWAENLPFADHALDGATCVTVLQHLPYALQDAAITEITRCLKPGGIFLLMEHLTDAGQSARDTHWEGVFPRAQEEWIHRLKDSGLDIIGQNKFQFIPMTSILIRALDALEQVRQGLRQTPQPRLNHDAVQSPSLPALPSVRLRLYKAFRCRVTDMCIALDYPLDILLGSRFGSHIALLARNHSINNGAL